jgi:hypothetical protein
MGRQYEIFESYLFELSTLIEKLRRNQKGKCERDRTSERKKKKERTARRGKTRGETNAVTKV